MLKRALYLFLFSAALVLLMSLMVVGAEESGPDLADRPLPVQAVLMPPDAAAKAKPLSDSEQLPMARAVLRAAPDEQTALAQQPVADANGVPILAGPYCLSAYFAFCLTCSAG